MLKLKKIGAADEITSSTAKSSKNNVFTTKETTDKVPPNIFRSFQVRKRI